MHIGGTNGKGSVAVMVYEALRASGARVALYLSPHLVEVRERIIVDDRPITEDAFAMWTELLAPRIETEDASFFEAATAIAFADFAARRADIAVVEVGLGGRLDATNVVDPLATAVTRIARDHIEYLGESLTEIAREKAGIAKPGVPFVIGETNPPEAADLARAAAEVGAEVRRVPPDAVYDGPLSLEGRHQRRNAAVAEAVVAALPAPYRPGPAQVRYGFARARLPGRFDRRGKWIFDVAHNPDAVEILIEALTDAAPPRPLHALAAFLDDKDWMTSLARLSGAVDTLWATDAPSAPPNRKWDLDVVRRCLAPRIGIRTEADFGRALVDVQQGAATILVCGSFHTVGDAMARLPGFAPLG